MDDVNPNATMNIGETAFLPAEPGFFEKLALIFSSPTTLFESLKRKSSWLLPLILLILVSIIIGLIVQPYVMQSVRRDTIAFLSGIPNLPDGTIERTTESLDAAAHNGFAKNLMSGVLNGLFIHGLFFFVVVTILFLVGAIFFGGTAKYIKVMSMYAWIMPIWTLGLIIAAPLMIIKRTHGLALSPAVMVTHDITSPIFFLLKNLNLFTIWAVILMGIGFSIIYGVSRAKGIVTMLILWGAWILVSSFIPFFNFWAYMTGLT
jgi:hypothetical protein